MENLKYTEILQANKTLSTELNGNPYRISVLSNVTINAFKDILEYFLRINKIEPEIELGNYDNILQDTMQMADKDMVIIMYEMLNVADSVDSYFEDIDEELYHGLKNKMFSEIDLIFENLKNIPTVIFNTFSSAFFVPDYLETSKTESLVRDLNNYVELKKTSNVTVINIDKVIAQSGIKAAFDQRFYSSSKAPYSLSFLKNYCTALRYILLKNTGKLKKAVIFDCDNTLWKGVIGEDGAEGIDMSPHTKTGKDFSRVQQMAKMLAKKGVIVGICSKNNPEDVDKILTSHEEVILKDEFIVIKKVNWEDKASNLRAIAKELNIGRDSLVFVDDSSFEINLIKDQMPEVLAIQVPMSGYADLLQQTIYSYFNLKPTKEDINKTAIYKEQFQREEAKSKAASLEDYLASLQIEITIEENNVASITRIAQLTQKTNQFNLTTKRYTENQIEQFVTDPDVVVATLSVKDKFGDNGLTGVCIIKSTVKTSAVIDTFLMSCRVIGRNIEISFLNNILNSLKDKGFSKVFASFVSSSKNAQVNTFYEKRGFSKDAESEEGKEYSINLNAFTDHTIKYIKVTLPQNNKSI